MKSQSGFSLVELVTVLVIAAIVISIAVPSFETLIASNRLTTASNDVVALLQTMRQEALRRNRRVVVCPTDNPTAANPTCSGNNRWNGWMGFVDNDGNNIFNAGDELLRVEQVKAPTIMSSSSNITGPGIIFRSDGLSYRTNGSLLAGNLSVCLERTNPPDNIRLITVQAGRIGTTRSGNGSGECAIPANP